jgi:hypothetical protein
VLRIVTSLTGGQLEFTTIADLRLLGQLLVDVEEYGWQCRRGMAEPLRRAKA